MSSRKKLRTGSLRDKVYNCLISHGPMSSRQVHAHIGRSLRPELGRRLYVKMAERLKIPPTRNASEQTYAGQLSRVQTAISQLRRAGYIQLVSGTPRAGGKSHAIFAAIPETESVTDVRCA